MIMQGAAESAALIAVAVSVRTFRSYAKNV
jgi:hypothetical protein